MISKKIFACRFEYIMKQGTIKNASRYLKNANVLANDFKQFLASCHVQEVNNFGILYNSLKKRIQSNYRDKNRCRIRDLNPDRQSRSASPYPLGHETS